MRKEPIERTWKRFNSGDRSAENDLMEYYLPLVDKIVGKLTTKLPSYVDKDELRTMGMWGLMDAINKFEDQGYKFETYAPFRIRGAVYDFLRNNDWTSRSVRKENRQIEEVIADLSVQLGRTPSDHEVADHLGMTIDEYHQTRVEAVWATHSYLDEAITEEGEAFSAWELVEDVGAEVSLMEYDDLISRLSGVVYDLDDQEQAVMALYYNKSLSLKEIGQMLNVTESRACQIHTRTLDKIRDAWSMV